MDPCPNDPNNDSPDFDGLCGDVDPDDDNDGIEDSVDTCPNDAENDVDSDGLCADVDPCPWDTDNIVCSDGQCVSTFYIDFDGDGNPNPIIAITACTVPLGWYITNPGTDCDDTDPNITSGCVFLELCNEIDDDGDGLIDDDDPDLNGSKM